MLCIAFNQKLDYDMLMYIHKEENVFFISF